MMDSSKPSISVVIPSYNRRASMLELLGDLSRQRDVVFEVIVVDDCSTDDSADALACAYPQFTLIRNPKNAGPAAARNRGILHARAPLVLGLDSDVSVPDSTALARLVAKFAAHPEVDCLALRILKSDGLTDDAPRWWHPKPIERSSTHDFYTSYFSGTAYAYRREAAVAAGLFPEILYMHYEEVVLALRTLGRGGSILYHPGVTVVHHAAPTSRRSRIQSFYKPRNQILLAYLCLPVWWGVVYVFPRLAYNLLLATGQGSLPELLSALRSAASLRGEALRQRSPLSYRTWLTLRRLRHYR